MGESFMAYHTDPLIREYNDRGMAKWMGFYLSEHTSEMDKEKAQRGLKPKRKPAMAQNEVSEILTASFKNRQMVEVQLNSLDLEGYPIFEASGIIEGFEGPNTFLTTFDLGLQIIPIESVQHARLINSTKWSDVS